jgi:hypothetical protein
VKVVRGHLGHGGLGPPAQIGDQRPDDGALLLERLHVAQQKVELDPADPHRFEHATARVPRRDRPPNPRRAAAVARAQGLMRYKRQSCALGVDR